jgi:PadR family transcriptional regulator AphA
MPGPKGVCPRGQITVDIYINTYIVEGMSLEHILLGLLRTPASGYDLKTIFDERIHYFWAAELSQIYPTLQNLERKGLLRSRRAESKRGPGRRVYQTTPAGHQALREWLLNQTGLGADRVAYLARLYMMDELNDLQETLDFLTGLREQFARNLSALEAIERSWAQHEPKFPDSLSPQMFHILLTLRNGIFMLGARVKWCDESIRRIRERMEKEGSHVRTISKSPLDAHRLRQHRTDSVLDSGGRKKRRPSPR